MDPVRGRDRQAGRPAQSCASTECSASEGARRRSRTKVAEASAGFPPAAAWPGALVRLDFSHHGNEYGSPDDGHPFPKRDRRLRRRRCCTESRSWSKARRPHGSASRGTTTVSPGCMAACVPRLTSRQPFAVDAAVGPHDERRLYVGTRRPSALGRCIVGRRSSGRGEMWSFCTSRALFFWACAGCIGRRRRARGVAEAPPLALSIVEADYDPSTAWVDLTRKVSGR